MRQPTGGGARFSGSIARTLLKVGSDILIGGVSVRAIARDLTHREFELLPEGDSNAAFADFRVYTVAPTFPLPPPGTAVLESGIPYTVVAGLPPERLQNAEHSRVIFCYRTPPPDSATADPQTGKRKDYAPKTNPLSQ